MKKYLHTNPFFIVLLPLFYILNLINEYYPVFTVKDLLLPISLWIIGITILLYLILCFVNPSLVKYSLLFFFLEVVYFFFGPLLNFLKQYLPPASHYIILLPLLLCITGALTIILRKRDHFPGKLFLYLNTLFVLLILIETGRNIVVTTSYTNQSTFRSIRTEEGLPASIVCDTCSKPDVYFIIFDGYSGPMPLKQYWDYDNSQLDSFFAGKGFYYASRAKSNYNVTAFSMASTLNMNYVQEKVEGKINLIQFCKAVQTVGSSIVCRIFQENKYAVKNISWMPLPGEKPILDINHLVNKRDLIMTPTLSDKLLHDVGWRWGYGKKYTPAEIKRQIKMGRTGIKQIEKTYQELLQTSATQNDKPVFVYAHFLIPHDPYFYDSTGKVIPESTWFQPKLYDAYYLSQLKYTNTVIKDIVTHLRTEGGRPRVIIIQSDHGYRSFKGISDTPNDMEFKTLSAIYFPDQNYSLLNDSISSVNTFRIVFNKYFRMKIPLLKDSSLFFRH